MTGKRTVSGFHAHIYFEESQVDAATELASGASETFEIRMGRVHRGPVGPHPIGSIQLIAPEAIFTDLVVWLMARRNGLTVFIHPLTGDDLYDHTAGAMWLGESCELNLSAL